MSGALRRLITHDRLDLEEFLEAEVGTHTTYKPSCLAWAAMPDGDAEKNKWYVSPLHRILRVGVIIDTGGHLM